MVDGSGDTSANKESHFNAYGGAVGTTANHSISADPQFNNTSEGDFSVSKSSPHFWNGKNVGNIGDASFAFYRVYVTSNGKEQLIWQPSFENKYTTPIINVSGARLHKIQLLGNFSNLRNVFTGVNNSTGQFSLDSDFNAPVDENKKIGAGCYLYFIIGSVEYSIFSAFNKIIFVDNNMRGEFDAGFDETQKKPLSDLVVGSFRLRLHYPNKMYFRGLTLIAKQHNLKLLSVNDLLGNLSDWSISDLKLKHADLPKDGLSIQLNEAVKAGFADKDYEVSGKMNGKLNKGESGEEDVNDLNFTVKLKIS